MWYWCVTDVILMWYRCDIAVVRCVIVVITLWYWCDIVVITLRDIVVVSRLIWFVAIVMLMWYPCVKRWPLRWCYKTTMGCCCDTDVILVWCWCDNNVLLIWCWCDTDVMSMWYRCRLDVITIGVSMSDRFVVRCCETLNPPPPHNLLIARRVVL